MPPKSSKLNKKSSNKKSVKSSKPRSPEKNKKD